MTLRNNLLRHGSVVKDMFLRFYQAREAMCSVCGSSSEDISASLGVCRRCVLEEWDDAREWAEKAHKESREDFSLSICPPRDGKACGKCVNDCRIPEGEKGFCGVRANVDGKIVSLVEGAVVDWYYDPLPTNCVAGFICPSCKDVEPGSKNLAVFYGACTFDCLFCQNWTYRNNTASLSPTMSAQDLASKRDPKTTCICYFGGDPAPQLIHALRTSRLALKKNENRVVRICWETNGAMNQKLLTPMAELSLKSGGCIKFDLKAFDEGLNIALCGVTNKGTLENFRCLSKFIKKRPDPPLLTASTLLIPGYVCNRRWSLMGGGHWLME